MIYGGARLDGRKDTTLKAITFFPYRNTGDPAGAIRQARGLSDERAPVLDRPPLGAALPIALLPTYHAWLIDGRRDLEIQDAMQAEVLDGDWRRLAGEARHVLDGFQGRLGIHGPYDGLPLASGDPRVRTLVADRLRQALEFGAELGATQMVLHSPFLAFGSPFVAHAPHTGRADHIGLVHATLEPVLPLAREAGCTLVIENVLDTNPLPLVALVKSFGSEYVQMSLDVGHAYITQRAGGPPPDQWVRDAGALLAHVHLQDTDGHLDRHWAPGVGSVNWYALFEALADLHHRPRLIMEVRGDLDAGQAGSWLVQRGLAC